MEDYNSETESDYTSYWRDWVGGRTFPLCSWQARSIFVPSCCVCFVAGISFSICCAVEPGRVANLSLVYICSSSRASLDSGNRIGTHLPDPLAPSVLGHCKYISATSSKAQPPRAVVHFKKI